MVLTIELGDHEPFQFASFCRIDRWMEPPHSRPCETPTKSFTTLFAKVGLRNDNIKQSAVHTHPSIIQYHDWKSYPAHDFNPCRSKAWLCRLPAFSDHEPDGLPVPECHHSVCFMQFSRPRMVDEMPSRSAIEQHGLDTLNGNTICGLYYTMLSLWIGLGTRSVGVDHGRLPPALIAR